MARIIPLNSLRYFESAARLLSFTKASEELNVTPAAISQQIRQLEDYLGVTLFYRVTRAVKLTEEARAVLPLISDGFDKLNEAVARLTTEQESGLLTVSTPPSFAAKWLLQRLPDFSNKYPNIDLRLDASLLPRDFERDDTDINIRLSSGEHPGLHASRLFGVEFSPVCSPELATVDHPLQVPQDLKNHRLLHIDWGYLETSLPGWRMWFQAAGIEDINLEHGPHFNFESLAIESAINGNGVALVSHRSVAGDLKAGRLVKPFNLTLPVDYAYWLVCPHEYLHRAKVSAFRSWLLEEASRDVADW